MYPNYYKELQNHMQLLYQFIPLCGSKVPVGGSKVSVVTVNALQHRVLSGGHVFPFDV